MTDVIVTIKVMPESVDVDLSKLENEVKAKISSYGGEVGKVEIKPIAFGLNSLELIFVVDEDKGSTDKLEEDIKDLEGVGNVDVTDVRRAIG
jgi:elongation factor 1-beta